MEISIQYDRKDHHIRFLRDTLHFIEKCSGIKDFVAVKVGMDISKKILVFKPLPEEDEGSYRLSKGNSICSVALARSLKKLSGHSGFYKYPLQWHNNRKVFVVDLKKGIARN